MSCAKPSGGMASDQLFKQAFADRFASLNSAFSSSPGSEVDFVTLGNGPGCQSCQAFSAPARDMHAGAWGGEGAAARPTGVGSSRDVLQWLLFAALVAGIIMVLGYIMRRLWKSREAAGVAPPLVFGAGMKPSSGGTGAVSGGAKDVTKPDEILPSGSDGDLHVIFFHATWCHHCKSMMPDFKAAALKHGGKAKFKMVEADVLKAAKDLSSKFDIKGFPMTAFMRGKEIIEKIVGRVEAAELEKAIKKHAPSK